MKSIRFVLHTGAIIADAVSAALETIECTLARADRRELEQQEDAARYDELRRERDELLRETTGTKQLRAELKIVEHDLEMAERDRDAARADLASAEDALASVGSLLLVEPNEDAATWRASIVAATANVMNWRESARAEMSERFRRDFSGNGRHLQTGELPSQTGELRSIEGEQTGELRSIAGGRHA